MAEDSETAVTGDVALAPRSPLDPLGLVSLCNDAHCLVLRCGWKVSDPPPRGRGLWRFRRPPEFYHRKWTWRLMVRNPHDYPILITAAFELRNGDDDVLDKATFGSTRYGDELGRDRFLLENYRRHFAEQVIGPGETQSLSGVSEYDVQGMRRRLVKPVRLTWRCCTTRLF